MQINRLKGVVERYVGEVDGADKWETVFDIRTDGISQLEFVIAEIKRDERTRFKEQLKRFMEGI